jgi:phosphonate transport system substrate-binding protein
MSRPSFFVGSQGRGVFLACVLATAALLAGCARSGDAGAEAAAAPAVRKVGELSLPKLVVALKPDKNPEQMLAEKQSLERYLSAKLGRPVEVTIPTLSATILEGFANGSIDIGYLSSSDMRTARERGMAELLLAGEIAGKNSYQSYWLAKKEKPYSRIEDLRGKPVAFASKTSTSGYLVPHADLVRKGLLREGQPPEAFFGRGNVWYGTGYVSAIQQVLNGQAEAAAVSDYVMDGDKHLTPEQKSGLKIVCEQGPVPTHVIAIRRTVSAADRELIEEAILEMNQENPALRDKVFTSKMVHVEEEEHLRPLLEAFRLTGRGDGR